MISKVEAEANLAKKLVMFCTLLMIVENSVFVYALRKVLDYES